MSSQNVELIRGIYEAFARGDVASVLSPMSPDIRWCEAEHSPYADGNPYVGPAAVAQGVFFRCGSEWDGFGVAVEQLLDAGDSVVMLGRYTGTFKATGRKQNPQVAHVWRLAGGKAVSFQQHVDTLHLAQVTAKA